MPKSNREQTRRSLGLLETVTIGVGGMVGGGIFAVLGLAAQGAHGGTPVAFLLSGFIALLTAYSYARLAVRYPSQGGTVEYINQAFGPGRFSGSMNILLWLSYAVMLALYASAFGSYAASFFPTSQLLWKHILSSAVVILLTGLNLAGARVVGNAEAWIVSLKIVILLFFVAMGFAAVTWGRLAPSEWTNLGQLIAGGMVIFLAYEGFELIVNTAGEVRSPERNVPRALFISVGFVIALYILVSLVAVGALPVAKIVAAKDYALAAAARPFLGAAGFALIAIAAMLSTASAINATLYGASRISYIIAKDGELPQQLERKIWNRPAEGLLITGIATLILTNALDLSSISMIGSSGFLLIFFFVNLANVRLHRETASSPWISGTAAVLTIIALAILLWQTAMTAAWKLSILGGMLVLAWGIETTYRARSRRREGRPILAESSKPASPSSSKGG